MIFVIKQTITGEIVGRNKTLGDAFDRALSIIEGNGVTKFQGTKSEGIFTLSSPDMRGTLQIGSLQLICKEELSKAGTKEFRFQGRPTASGWLKSAELDALPRLEVNQLITRGGIRVRYGDYFAIFAAVRFGRMLMPVAIHKLPDVSAIASLDLQGGQRSSRAYSEIAMGLAGEGCLENPPPGTVALFVVRREDTGSFKTIAKRYASHGEGGEGRVVEPSVEEIWTKMAADQRNAVALREPASKRKESQAKEMEPVEEVVSRPTSSKPRVLMNVPGAPGGFKQGYTDEEREAMEEKARREGY